MMTSSLLFLLTFCTSAMAADPEPMLCCDGQAASKSMAYYDNLRDILSGRTNKGWQAQITGWFSYIRSPRGSDLTDEDRRVFADLMTLLVEIQKTNRKEVLRERFPEVTQHMHYLALRHPGGRKSVALIGCGDKVWLQDPSSTIVQPYGDCAYDWVRPAIPEASR